MSARPASAPPAWRATAPRPSKYTAGHGSSSGTCPSSSSAPSIGCIRKPNARTAVSRTTRKALWSNEPTSQRANDHTLHQAQCRWTVAAQTPRRKSFACAGRLDDRTAPARDRPQPTADILRFQRSLRDRLKSPTRTSDASEYFTDLRLATALISTTWPHSRDLLGAKAAERIDLNSQKPHDESGGWRNQQALDTPPRDPVVCGALLMAADRLLSRDDLPDLLSEITRTAFGRPSSRTPWAVLYDRHKNDCSERLRLAAEPATRALPRVNGRGGTRAPLRTGYQAEHIPAFLEPDRYRRHLADCAGSESKTVRRTAAVRLVQWAMFERSPW